MAIKRGNIDLDVNDEDQNEDQESQKDDSAERLAASEKARQDAELRAARAEGEADAMKRGVKTEAPIQAQLSDSQWQELEQAHGKTRQQIMADAQLTRATAEEAMKPLRDMLSATQKEAAEAKAEAKRAKAGTSLYAVEKDFFDKNPGLAGHRGDIDSFLAKFPDEMRSDPAKFKELLTDAKTFVRGKVRDSRDGKDTSNSRDNVRDYRRNQSDRPEFNDDEETRDDENKVDTSDLDNEGSRRLIENLARRPGGEDLMEAPPAIDEVSIEKAYKLSERNDGRGVSIDERGEFARGRRQADGSLRDPSRSVRLSDEQRERREEVKGRR